MYALACKHMKVPPEGSTITKNDKTVALEQHKNYACAFLGRTELSTCWYILHIGINKWRSYQFLCSRNIYTQHAFLLISLLNFYDI